MEFCNLINSPKTKLLYDNFNKVYLFNHQYIIKKFAKRQSFDREVYIYKKLKKIGYKYILDIIDCDFPFIKYDYVAEGSFDQSICLNSFDFNLLLDAFYLYPHELIIDDQNKHIFPKNKWMNDSLAELKEEKSISPNAFEKYSNLVLNYNCKNVVFLHGDMRPHNILGDKKVISFIDLECAEMGDINRDLAYLFMGTFFTSIKISKKLLIEIKKIKSFDAKSFQYYLLYYHLACLNNSKIDKKNILKSLRDILR